MSLIALLFSYRLRSGYILRYVLRVLGAAVATSAGVMLLA